MTDLSLADLVVLHLDEVADDGGRDVVPRALTPAGIAEAVEVEQDHLPARLRLLSALDDLRSDGLVETAVREVAGGGERNVHFLTGAGRERAASLRATLATDGAAVPGVPGPPSEAPEYVDADSLAGALARLVDVPELGGRAPDRSPAIHEDARETLDAAREAATQRGGRVVLVAGEAGTGKSPLVEDAADAAREAGFTVAQAACHPGTAEPYAPVRRAFEAFDDDAVAAAFDGAAGAGVDDHEALSARRTALFNDVVAAVRERATDRPVLLVVDDLQWADEPTAALLAHVAEGVAAWIYPVLLVGTYRPAAVDDDHPLWALRDRLDDDRFERLELSPLSRAETRDVVHDLVGEAPPPAFVETVQEATDGNPLFVREVVSSLLADGTVDPAAGEYPDTLSAADVPDAAERAVRRRLEPLDDDGWAVLAAAAAVGRSVPFDLLAAVVDRPAPDCRDYADMLVDAGVLEWTGDALRFTSEVVREAALSAVPDDERRRRHERVAEHLAARESPPHAEVARHFERADRPAAALEHYRAAAGEAAAVYAHEAALDDYRQALDLADEVPDADRPGLLVDLGETLFVLGRYDDAADRFEAALAATDDPATAARVHHQLAEIEIKRGDVADGLARAEAGLSVADAADVPPAARCQLHRTAGWAQFRRGDVESARDAFRRQREVAEAADDARLHGLALHDLGTLAGRTGDLDRGGDLLERAAAHLDAADARRHRAKTLTNLALVYRYAGDLDAARGAIDDALAIQRDLGLQESRPNTLLNRGVIAEAQGELREAVDHYEAALEASRRAGRESTVGMALNDLAGVRLRLGDPDAAADRTREAIDRFETLDHREGLARAHATRSRVERIAGDADGARDAAETALELARELDNDDRISAALLALGLADRAAGAPDAAVRRHETALDHVDAAGNPVVAAEVRTELAADHLAAGRAERAHELAGEALDTAEDGDDRLLTCRVRTVFGDAARAAGDHDRAAETLRAALEHQRNCDARVDACRTLLALARLERDRGDPDAAREHLDDAAALADDHGLGLYADGCGELRETLRTE